MRASVSDDLVSRRSFLHASLAAAGGLLVGCRVAPGTTGALETPSAAPAPADAPPQPGRFGAYVEILPDDRVILWTPQSEMGQGVHDALPKILCEELEADWRKVEVRLPHFDEAFVNPITKRQRTANSESVAIYYELLRRAGAATREMLVVAAARQWKVPREQCSAAASHVTHAPSGRSASYGALAALAATLPAPQTPALKSPRDFRLIGVSLPRKDTPAKCDGSLAFGIDVRRPDMLYAALRRSPAVTSRLVRFDRDSAMRRRGVIDAFAIADGVAVVADSTWHALQAAEALDAEFDEAAAKDVEHEEIRRRMRAALDDDAAALPGRAFLGGPPFDRDATLAALKTAPRRADFVYEVPFLAHAALEPLACAALVTESSCEVWAPSQQPDRSVDAIAQMTGLSKPAIRFNTTFLGGGFGRKWELDFVRQAVEIANRMKGRPIKLTWTREQEFQHDRYRPAHLVRTRLGLDRQGRILAMHSRTTGVNMWKYQGRAPLPGPPMGDPFATGLLINDRHAIPARYVDYVETDLPIPVGTWRSVSQSMNNFFFESALDDAAALGRRDPLDLRRELLAAEPRALKVLELAAQKAQWDRPLPRGRGRGIALSIGFGSYCAEVVEVSASGKAVKVERIVCAFDCGTVIDPRTLEAQLEGGIVWGLSAARNGRITFENGAARETNFHLGPILNVTECPRIEIHLAPSGDVPGGAGEASVPPVAPALASAIHAATGTRPRRLPIIEVGFELA
jgi:CO/xanthine dehydrogenase Mo-binding subunit